jgi:hypothetical protein
LNNFLVEKSTADAILILLPANTGPALYHFATVALVLTPVLSGLAIFVTTPPSKSTKVYAIVEIQNLMECRGVETTALSHASPTVY